MTFTVGALIAKHGELKTAIAEIQDRLDAELKPYTTALDTISQALLVELQNSGGQNFKCKETGATAYLSTTMHLKVADRGEFLGFLIENRAWDMLDARPLKEPVKNWLDDNNGTPPPGVTVEFITKCNVRRS